MICYDVEQDVYRAEHDFSSGYSLSETLSLALEEAATQENASLSTRLYEVVNPDGLRVLFKPVTNTPRNNGSLSFTLDQFTITVQADGSIIIRPP